MAAGIDSPMCSSVQESWAPANWSGQRLQWILHLLLGYSCVCSRTCVRSASWSPPPAEEQNPGSDPGDALPDRSALSELISSHLLPPLADICCQYGLGSSCQCAQLVWRVSPAGS